MTQLTRIKAVLFDAVGTLIYADPPVAQVYHSVGRRYGSRLSEPEVGARFERCLRRPQNPLGEQDPLVTNADAERRRWRRLVHDVFEDSEDAASIFEELWDHFARPASWVLYADVASGLRAITEQGVRVGVASNFDERLDQICSHLNPLLRTTSVFHSAGLGYRKPALEFFGRIQESLRLAPSQLLMVGDDYDADFRGARRAGWHAVWLNRDGLDSLAGEHSNLTRLPEMIAAG